MGGEVIKKIFKGEEDICENWEDKKLVILPSDQKSGS